MHYKKQNLLSQKELFSFAIENDLLQNLDESSEKYNGELIRINSVNKIRKFNELLSRFKELKNDNEGFYNLAINIEELRESNIVEEINIQNQILTCKTK